MFRAGMKTMFLITGTIMGAGYASGREIWQFFGGGSGLAIGIFTVIFTIAIANILFISYNRQSTNYVPVLEQLIGKRLAKIYDYLIVFYLFSVTVIMIAASGATFQTFGMPFAFGIVFIIVGLLIIFSKGIGELLSMNQILMPLLLLSLLIILINFMQDEQVSLLGDWSNQTNWFASFPFSALNILPLVAVLGAIGSRIKSKGEILIAALVSGLLLGVITYLYNLNLTYLSSEMDNLPELPLYAIINNYSHVTIVIMMLMLWIAIYTTAAATLLGIVTRMNKRYSFSFFKMAIICLAIMLPFSWIGFTQLVAIIYPLYGILNLYILLQILISPFRKIENSEINKV